MQWTITQPATELPITWDSLKTRLRVDDTERTNVLEFAQECVDYAEQKMQCSLMQREITARYWGDDALHGDDQPFLINYGYQYALPRGPVISITSVKDSLYNDMTFRQYCVGNSDRFLMSTLTYNYPITVVYQAGYATADLIPADIKRVIKVHAATSYMYRESLSILSLAKVESIDDFYCARGRGVRIA